MELDSRLDTAVRLIDETHRSSSTGSMTAGSGPIAKEARGLAVVLLFAAYENLLSTLTRTLLEAAIKCRVGNRRLRPGFRMFAIESAVKSMKDMSDKKIYSHSLPRLLDQIDSGGRACTINPAAFPSDGSFMKTSQIKVWCDTFEIGPPQRILRRTWGSVDTIVMQRNHIAHGAQTPDEVGREYSEAEIRTLIEDWRQDWTDFLVHVEQLGSSRDFYRLPR
ncbi:hypothetical protein [Kocuria marina]|uniref:hypothetical protein n=1 Tax=Kocuria marina TaxID=223184 RepID=UPI003460B264